LRGSGKLRPATIAAHTFPPGKKFPVRQKLPSAMGKYFHFSKKATAKNPTKPRKMLVHAGTGQR
jgi:hypothetical protein